MPKKKTVRWAGIYSEKGDKKWHIQNPYLLRKTNLKVFLRLDVVNLEAVEVAVASHTAKSEGNTNNLSGSYLLPDNGFLMYLGITYWRC